MVPAQQILTASPANVHSPAATRKPWGMTLCILAADIVALLAVLIALVAVRRVIDPEYQWDEIARFLPFLGLAFPAFYVQKLYPGLLIHPAEEMRRVFYAISAMFLIWATTTFLWRTGGGYSRALFLMGWVASPPAILLSRHLTRRWFGCKTWWGIPAVILGSGPTAWRIARKLRSGMLGIKVAGVFSENQILSWAHDMPPVLGDLSAAPDVAGARVAQYAIVAIVPESNLELGRVIEDYCRGFGHVLLIPDMTGICSLGVTARDIEGELGLELPQKLFHLRSALAKRAMDCLVSLVLIVLLAPLFALIAIAIKLTSKGPVFYGHLRQGRHGQPFRALKFRTMVSGADRVLADYLVSHTEYVPEWQRNHKLKNDPRITRIGKWLRRASLDELPQLINVLLGQMSLVGPRPIVREEIPKYGRGYELYTRVFPGITGLWQVSGRNNTTYEERVAYDEHYVHNWSVWLDLYILVRTVRTVVTAEGAY
ncbi:MAG: undecaprenyl-phosphate galactose phosphotransferase WbaP [Bryobacteraceae bacterium]|jgi:Undecaprenyl-phosphate galactose phosphotransferase WbaP